MQKQQIKKIKYGNRDKTKQKKNMYIQSLKDGDDDVCGAVLDSFNSQYLSYISSLVKASKTPSKMRTQERIQGLFQNKDNNQKKQQVKPQPMNVVNKNQNTQISPKSPKSYSDLKNSTLPLKNFKQGNETNQRKNQRDKSSGSVFQKLDNSNPLKIDRNFTLKGHLSKEQYNRFSTQEAQKPTKQIKFDQTSINLSQQSQRNANKNAQPNKQFLQGLNQYLVTLQSHRNNKKSDFRKNSSKSRNDEQISTVQQLFQENLKLRKKLKKYQQKMSQIQQNMENHFMQGIFNLGRHCKRQQKSHKAKINDLTKALLRAITKVNEQKDQIQNMKYQLRTFGRKAQYCVQKYQQQSSQGQQQIQQSLLKAMRPSRATSQYKLKKKLNIPYLDFMNRGGE